MNGILHRPSPNHDARPPGLPIDVLVLHYTGMPDAAAALARLTDPAAEVSAHYLVGEDGTVWQLVPEERRAWHAGRSWWRGMENLNDRSIGIEIVNPGHAWGYRPFPALQMAAVCELSLDILARHPIPARNVVAHSDIAPDRKTDPGELFDWEGFARNGVGLWPFGVADEGCGEGLTDPAALRRLRADLARLGYRIAPEGGEDEELVLVLRAFQRHWRPEAVTGRPDRGTRARLAGLLALVGEGG